ncbi:hypothetical protein [Rhizobium sp. Root1220]|uniref:hypothetical protein n=1 Tax=Rhizobium sp. Root1220 TaxID=1736432 RepID=UPI0007020BF0|nr:hypothetical protein [Rhizobium sp. Root1220]KQV81876.1 hypothetical protein ASC90_24810 [Rhizobium sp. Root1220]
MTDRRIDTTVINSVLKALSRENGIERERKSVMQVATLLLALWNQGIHDRAELETAAREKWAEAKDLGITSN